MLAEDHASPVAKVLSLPLKTNSTIFETSHFVVELEKCQTIKDTLPYIRSILRYIATIYNTEERKRVLSNMKIEIEHTVQSTDINVLQDYLDSVYINNSQCVYQDNRSICLFFLIVYHVLAASENEDSTQILNVIKVKHLQLCKSDFQYYLDCPFQLYLDVYYKDNPNDIFTNIHSIWKCDKATEFNLKLTYCKNLNEAKDYKTLIQLIHHHADNLIESFEENEHEQCNSSTAIMVLLHVLHYQVSLNKMERVKTIATILSRLSMSIMRYDKHFVLNGFYDFILTLDNKQLLCIPYVIKLFHSLMKERPLDYLCMILLSSDRLRQANHYTECIEFIKSNFQFISSFPTKKLKVQVECYYRQQYCITLLLLLNEYVTCYDTHNINLMLTKLLDFRVSFLSDIQSTSCYCFMGNEQCMTVEKHLQYLPSKIHESQKRSRGMFDFKQHLLDIYNHDNRTICSKLTRSSQSRDFLLNTHSRVIHYDYDLTMNIMNMDPRKRIPRDYDLMMNNVIKWELEQTSYLKSIIEMMEINRYKLHSFVSFIEFIKRSADYNVASLYNIIKVLCAFELKPEIQDMILQGVTAYLMISCNKQYGMLSKFILDINMICPKGQFLHKLTSGIAKTLLKFDDDTVKDFNNIIYKCYCTVRHDCRDEKDKNVKKYKDHFTFIASMEAEEEMKKLTSLANLLLLLTLLLIASGGHHKSAKLKKYLSLKYEYRDSILYLLWCSGDVEINPGPTLCTLMKVPDSVKERNWIYEMCSILLRLLKYSSIDLKNDGLWKAKPLHWPNGWPFYDPRNKPKGQGYNTVTDRKLLENLEEQCNGKGLLKDLSKFDDEHTKSNVRQYKMEIIAWKNNRTELFTLHTLRQEQDTLKAAKLSLNKYKNDSELHKGISGLSVDIIFDTDDVTSNSSEVYTDIVRDIAITFCRIGKRLSPLVKSDGIWKMQPSEWNPNHLYYSPCNAGKRKEKGQDQKLVDNLLTYCESKNITIPAELQPLLKAWKQRNTSEITKYYTIWSKTAIINHSLKYLELEGLLEKCHVHESLKQIGLILDTQYWRCPSPKKVTYTDSDDKSQDSGFSDTSHSSHCSDSQTANLTNSSQKVLSFQKIKDNHLAKLTNSTNANLNATDDSSCGIDSHTNDHLCNTELDLDNQWKELSNQTCLKSYKANLSILTSKAQSEHDVQHYTVLSTDSTNSKQKGYYKKISQNTSKRKRPNEDESYSDLKRPYISEVELPLSVASSMNSDAETRDINNRITSDQYVDNIVNLLDDLEQDYSSTTGKASIQDSSSTTNQSSDVCNELPEYVQLYIDTVENSYNPDDTLNMDVDQFIEEQDMDLS